MIAAPSPDCQPRRVQMSRQQAVEAGARALTALGRVEQDGLTVGQQVEREWSDPETREYLLAHSRAVLEAIGYADLLDALAARDAEIGWLTRLAEGIKREADGFYENRNLWQRRTEKAEVERDAARAALDRVRAVADEWDQTDGDISPMDAAGDLRTVLYPEGGE